MCMPHLGTQILNKCKMQGETVGLAANDAYLKMHFCSFIAVKEWFL